MVLQDDEQRIWTQSKEEQLRLDRSGHLYANSEITAYVNRVAEYLLVPSLKQAGVKVQVRIIENPMLNAFAFPHGVIYLHTGILARMENEAQLATLLGHELTHATHRHAIQEMRSLKTTTATLAGLGVVLAPFGPLGSLAMVLGQVGGLAAVTGYSRSLEAEADQVGLDLVVAAGYDPHESPKLFEYLKRDLEEQDLDEPFFFGTHPKLVDRLEEYQTRLDEQYVGQNGQVKQESFLNVMEPLFLDNARLDLAIGRFVSAEASLTRYLTRDPQSAEAYYLLGETYRQRGEDDDWDKAIEAFGRATQLRREFSDPHRSLGTMYYKQEQWNDARLAFEQYLVLSPAALDRKFIEAYVEELQKK